jgi:tRNA pseudouridine38-40 synthase
MSQVCDFETNIDRNKKNWLNGLNSNLPGSLAVKDIFEVPADFNSRFSAIERKYAYLIYNSDNKPLFFEKHAHWITNKLNTVIMEEELKKFIGKKDFSSFRSSNCNSNNAIKTVNDVSLKTINNFIIITIVANAFLQNMVRIMVGTLIDIAKKENSMSIEEILVKKNRSFAGKTAPACGLFFLGPSYKDELKIKSCEKSIIERLKI